MATFSTAYALAKENEQFIERMVRMGRFNNQSEVVREALRRMEREESAWLNPPPLTPEEAKRSFSPNEEEDKRELESVRNATVSLRRLIRKHKNIDEL